MPQFFVSYSDKTKNAYYIRGEDYYHLTRVRRIKKNDIINLRDDKGALIISKVTDITGDHVEAKALSIEENNSVPIKLILCQSLIKGKKFDMVVRKTVEIGAAEIIPVVSERTVKVPGQRMTAKSDRWNRIASEASKQSMRDSIPQVGEPVLFNDLVKQKNDGIKILARPGAGNSIRNFFMENTSAVRGSNAPVYILVGPEGGFTDREIEDAEMNGWISLSFGFTEMRAETAAIVLTSIIIYEWSANI